MPSRSGATPCVLVAAARAAWEPAVLDALTSAGMVVLRRCVDLDDLLALALQGQAEAAVVSASLGGLDADAVRRLDDAGVAILAVSDGSAGASHHDRMHRLGVVLVAPEEAADRLGDLLAAGPDTVPVPADDRPAHRGEAAGGRSVAVWGPTGAPGRSTVAMALAAERATVSRVVLCDADPYGGTLAQHLGVVEDVSGLLAVARLANEAALDHAGLAASLRRVAPGLDLLTGLPRPERWREVREGVVSALVQLARAEADPVVDCGFSIEEGSEQAGVPRNVATLEALAAADAIVVVGSAEPAGLTRLARSLVALTEVVPEPPAVVVVNRMRDSLGWRGSDVTAMIEGFAPGVPVRFWPEERAVLDRAMISGRSLAELGEHPLRACARDLADLVFAN